MIAGDNLDDRIHISWIVIVHPYKSVGVGNSLLQIPYE